jgi:hypothetical protein
MLHRDYFFVILLTFGLYLLQFYWTGGRFWRH